MPEIDGLKAFAIISVIIYHFDNQILPGGYLGVDMFFVISGYVITLSLHKRSIKNFKNFIISFYQRRFKRLLPALLSFLIPTGLVLCIFNPNPNHALKTGITSLFGFSNIALYLRSIDYFAQSSELNPFTQTWSLGVEVQFYLVFPFLIWFTGFVKETKNSIQNFNNLIIFLGSASLVSYLYIYPMNQSAAYFLMPTRFWEFAAGCLIFTLYERKSALEKLINKLPSVLIFAIIIGVMFLPYSFASISKILIVIGTSFLIICLKKKSFLTHLFSNSYVIYIGLISYSLYLWHWGVISISKWILPSNRYTLLIQIIATLIFSILSYEFIEKKFRKLNYSKLNYFFITVLALLSTCLFFLSLILGLKKSIYFPSLLGMDLEERKGWGEFIDCNGEKKLNKIKNPIEQCLKTKRTENKTHRFFLIGDSHAAQLLFMAKKVFHNSSTEVAFINNDQFISHYVLGNPKDSDHFNELEEIVSVAQRDDILAIAFHRGQLNPRRDSHFININKDTLNLVNSAYLRMYQPLKKLVDKGVRIVLIRDVPLLLTGNRNITTCILQDKFFKENVCTISHQQDTLTRQPQDILFNKLINSLQIESWDPRKYMLSSFNRYEINDSNGNQMMLDQHHITKSFSEYLADFFLSDVVTNKPIK